MARLRKIPLETKCLARVKNIPPQTSLEASEREKNVRGAFQVKREEKVSGKIVLLVDDVYTTGSTIRECCLMLKRAGAKEVRALTVAQA
jgi:predicted amidophosphoribosyltransferase